jgi:hypothetical protein
MPFKPWVRNISPLAWCLGVSAFANAVTMAAVLYIAFGKPYVTINEGYVEVSGLVKIKDSEPVRVQVVPR